MAHWPNKAIACFSPTCKLRLLLTFLKEERDQEGEEEGEGKGKGETGRKATREGEGRDYVGPVESEIFAI